ncbi:MAG: monovalent cation/H+ antiporter complex subunit F [Candidatus Acetothermia bacterium]
MISFSLGLLTLSAFLCLYRIGSGPTPADRMVGIDILGILVVGFCGLLTLITERAFYLNIALAWGLLSFIGTTALAKHLEGKKFDE